MRRDRKDHSLLAADAAQLAEDLPNRAAIRSAVGVAIKEEHLADLLSVFVSRRQVDCNRFVTIYQSVNSGIKPNGSRLMPAPLASIILIAPLLCSRPRDDTKRPWIPDK